jgi:hypothetical protein
MSASKASCAHDVAMVMQLMLRDANGERVSEDDALERACGRRSSLFLAPHPSQVARSSQGLHGFLYLGRQALSRSLNPVLLGGAAGSNSIGDQRLIGVDGHVLHGDLLLAPTSMLIEPLG